MSEIHLFIFVSFAHKLPSLQKLRPCWSFKKFNEFPFCDRGWFTQTIAHPKLLSAAVSPSSRDKCENKCRSQPLCSAPQVRFLLFLWWLNPQLWYKFTNMVYWSWREGRGKMRNWKQLNVVEIPSYMIPFTEMVNVFLIMVISISRFVSSLFLSSHWNWEIIQWVQHCCSCVRKMNGWKMQKSFSCNSS